MATAGFANSRGDERGGMYMIKSYHYGVGPRVCRELENTAVVVRNSATTRYVIDMLLIQEWYKYFLLFYFFVHFLFFIVLFVSLSISFFSLPLRCLLCLLQLRCSISVSWFCVSLLTGGRIGADTGCAVCRWVERTV